MCTKRLGWKELNIYFAYMLTCTEPLTQCINEVFVKYFCTFHHLTPINTVGHKKSGRGPKLRLIPV